MQTIRLIRKEKKQKIMGSVILLCLVMLLVCIVQIAQAETQSGAAKDASGNTSKPFETENVSIIMVSEALSDEKAKAALAENRIILLGFEDVHFDINKSALTPEARTILKRNIRLLEDNPDIQIRIAGYTSASGTQAYNQTLSEQRAQSVKGFLINEGLITPDRLSTIGYGEKNDAAPEEMHPDSAESNMRVLFEAVVNKAAVQK